MPQISQQEFQTLCLKALIKHGLDQTDAKTITDHLLLNEMSGKSSHGLVRVKWITDGIKNKGTPTGNPQNTIDLPSLDIIDGQNHIGIIAAQYATETALKKAQKNGIAFIGARNYHTTTGTMHVYNKQIAEAGLVGIIGCNSMAMVAHPQGFDPVIGTNPISIAIPGKETNFIHDVTTSEMSYGALMVLKKKGELPPDNVLIDADGNPSQDPKDAFKGALLPLKGFKGFGLGLAVELLAGPIIGAKGGREAVDGSDGLFIIAIDPSKLGADLEEIEAVLQEIKSSRKAGTTKELLIPGERSAKTYAQNKKAGMLEIPAALLQELKDLQT